MGSGNWFRAFICIKKSKSSKSKQAKVHSANGKSNGSEASNNINVAEDQAIRSPATTAGSQSSPIILAGILPVEEIAARRIQKAFRAHRSQIKARRICMVTEGRLKQKRIENQLKLEAKLQELEVEWCGGSETMEEILSRIQQREEAAVKRERAMAYAFSHQWRANASQYLGQASYGLGRENWGWSWMERWIAARPWEVRVHSQPIHQRKANHARQGSKSEKEMKAPGSVKPALPNGKVTPSPRVKKVAPTDG
ncbi:hypothetical protein CCACVL1_16431 [Corchorus capsularis]|uniref:IQ motif, EF-hand binding site n=1 Tax=Corchorus capsularis TaxID=210143 RepID=A0A1R3HX57_COCAP|nr:hypothetical protein CCACVL1_16431 [Corchorus capsularis]